MKELTTIQGNIILIDDDNFERFLKMRWTINEGYARRLPPIPSMYMHRLVMDNPLSQIDHINGNRLDNQRTNLRLVTQQQNNANAKKWSIRKTSSRYKGVSWNEVKQKWEVKICFNYKTIHLGRHTDENTAALVYNQKATELFGEFACLNEIK